MGLDIPREPEECSALDVSRVAGLAAAHKQVVRRQAVPVEPAASVEPAVSVEPAALHTTEPASWSPPLPPPFVHSKAQDPLAPASTISHSPSQ